MSVRPRTVDLRDHLRRYIGRWVAVRVSVGSLSVVGGGDLELIDSDAVKAVRVGDTTLTLDSWFVTEASTIVDEREPAITSWRHGSAAVTVGWYDLIVSDYEEVPRLGTDERRS